MTQTDVFNKHKYYQLTTSVFTTGLWFISYNLKLSVVLCWIICFQDPERFSLSSRWNPLLFLITSLLFVLDHVYVDDPGITRMLCSTDAVFTLLLQAPLTLTLVSSDELSFNYYSYTGFHMVVNLTNDYDSMLHIELKMRFWSRKPEIHTPISFVLLTT